MSSISEFFVHLVKRFSDVSPSIHLVIFKVEGVSRIFLDSIKLFMCRNPSLAVLK